MKSFEYSPTQLRKAAKFLHKKNGNVVKSVEDGADIIKGFMDRAVKNPKEYFFQSTAGVTVFCCKAEKGYYTFDILVDPAVGMLDCDYQEYNV